jgi:dTDP-4-dehydrorhamnose reductase
VSPSVLVIGRTGQLARELAVADTPLALEFLGRDALDLTRPVQAAEVVRARRPDLVLIAAAYTAVDRAESEEETARLVNADAPGAIARACAETGAGLLHVSTDYVFDGAKPEPYVEEDPIAPASAYGRTKAEGEAAIRASGARAAIVRTSWVYSPFGANFVKTMLRLADSREEVGVVADQLGRPTAAADLAAALLELGLRMTRRDIAAEGLFHYAGAGDATWAEFAEAVFAASARRGGKQPRVRRITTAEFPTPARRPANSRLDTAKIERLGVRPRPWREALEICLDRLGEDA